MCVCVLCVCLCVEKAKPKKNMSDEKKQISDSFFFFTNKI